MLPLHAVMAIQQLAARLYTSTHHFCHTVLRGHPSPEPKQKSLHYPARHFPLAYLGWTYSAKIQLGGTTRLQLGAIPLPVRGCSRPVIVTWQSSPHQAWF